MKNWIRRTITTTALSAGLVAGAAGVATADPGGYGQANSQGGYGQSGGYNTPQPGNVRGNHCDTTCGRTSSFPRFTPPPSLCHVRSSYVGRGGGDCFAGAYAWYGEVDYWYGGWYDTHGRWNYGRSNGWYDCHGAFHGGWKRQWHRAQWRGQWHCPPHLLHIGR